MSARASALYPVLAGLLAAFVMAVLGGAPRAQAADAAARESSISLLAELTPSTSLAAGAAMEMLGFEEKAEFTRSAIKAVPLQDLAELFGLDAGRLQWSLRSGGYQQSITPNVVVSVGAGAGDQARVAAFAMAWMYVFQQDAVPSFAPSAAGRPAVRLHFAQALTPARESAMFAALVAAQGRDAGYTRIGEREIVIIDFDGSAGFSDGIARFAAAMEAGNPVVRSERFRVRCEYPSHDWRSQPDGTALLARILGAYSAPGLEARLRSMRASYVRIVTGWLARPRAAPAAEVLLCAASSAGQC